jgi:hypothetical protein
MGHAAEIQAVCGVSGIRPGSIFLTIGLAITVRVSLGTGQTRVEALINITKSIVILVHPQHFGMGTLAVGIKPRDGQQAP